MNRMIRNVVGPVVVGPFGSEAPPPQKSDSRTWLKGWLVETVLPVVMLLSMSAMTVAMIVLIVTTVAHAGWLDTGTYVNVDPWSGVHSASDASRADSGLWAESAGSGDFSSGSQGDPGYFAAETPE